MKVLLLGHSSGQWSAKDRPHWKEYMSGIESWCMGFDGDYCHTKLATPEEVRNYDLIIANSDNARGTSMIPELLRLSQERRSDSKWVTLIEGDVKDYLPFDPMIGKLFDNSDLVDVINERTLHFFRSVTTTRCETIGIPYPAEAIRKLRTEGKRSNRPDIFIASRFYHEEHATLETIIAPPLAEEFGVKACMMFKEDRYRDPKLECFPEREMLDYLKLLAEQAYVFINLDLRYTWARDVLDCAALQIPCIATHQTVHADTFFPQLVVSDPFAFDEVRTLVKELYRYPHFWRQCANVPLEKLEPFSHANMNQRLLSYL